MAIYHFTAKVISRGKGQSAIAAAAYRSGQHLHDEQAGETKAYQARSQRILFTKIMAPRDAPAWAQDRNQLWNEAERAEKRKDAQLAREIEVSLPHELTAEQRERLVTDFARETFMRKGYAVDIAIHAPDKESDERNYHAHIMVTRRTLGPNGFAPTKDWQFNKHQLAQWREQWANLSNRYLERHGHSERIDHRSLAAQGVDRYPTIHVGYAAAEMTQRGAPSVRMEALQDILAGNNLRLKIKDIDAELAGLEGQVRTRAEAEKQLAQLAQKDERMLKGKTEQGFGAGARYEADIIRDEVRDARQAAAQEARQVRKDEVFWKQQEAWRLNRNQSAPSAGSAKPEQGLRVVDAATGAVTKLADFMVDFLAGTPAPAKEKPADMKAFVTDPAARKQMQLASVAASRQAVSAEKAIDNIREDMQAGRNLKSGDVKNLTRQHQEQIREFGDTAVRQMVEEAQRRAEQYWKGNERER